jgi:hypothetical protein
MRSRPHLEWCNTEKQARKYTCKRNMQGRSCNHFCREKAMCSIFWVCVCNLNGAACKAHRNSILSSVVCLVLPHFFQHHLVNSRIFEKNVSEHMICVWIFSANSAWNIFHSKNNYPLKYRVLNASSLLAARLLWAFKSWKCRPPHKQIYFTLYITYDYEIKTVWKRIKFYIHRRSVKVLQ